MGPRTSSVSSMVYIPIMHDTNVAGFDLNLLVAFDALANERHVTRAAARIGLSQPAMSHALKRLRDVLGDELFIRTPRGLVPTTRAETLAPIVARALVEVGSALAPPRAFDPKTLRRTFVVGTTDYAEIAVLPPLLARLRDEAPHVVLRFRPVAPTAEEDLEHKGYDLVVGPAMGTSPRLLAQKLFDDDFVTVTRRDHPVVKKRLSIEQFVALDHVQISIRGTPGGPVDDALHERGLRRRIALFVPHFLGATMIVAQSDLVLTVARRVAERIAPLVDLRMFTPPIAIAGFSIHQLWHERNHADPAHVWFRSTIAEAVRSLGVRAPR